MEDKQSAADGPDKALRRTEPLIFISHDTRDAEIAEAFSRLLGSVSAGVLKSFRSSDKKGNQGIEYGIEWFPEIMKRLETASDVVCLLTHHSINRPWILFEAGVARGRTDTPVHGIALGIPLNAAATGPFAQFQNLDDDVDSLTRLVIQLVGRIPNAEPDRDVVRNQVEAFKQKVAPLITPKQTSTKVEEKQEEASVAKIFEEVKVMFQDLPARIESRIAPEAIISKRRRRRISPSFFDELIHTIGKGSEAYSLLVAASAFRDDFPWIYELAVDLFHKIESSHPGIQKAARRFSKLAQRTLHSPIMWEMFEHSKERRYELEEMVMYLDHVTHRVVERAMRTRQPENGDELPAASK